jgi:hypothetical protein
MSADSLVTNKKLVRMVNRALENEDPNLDDYLMDFDATGLGPHHYSQLKRKKPISFATYTQKSLPAYACQIDCLSVIQFPGFKSRLFDTCEYRYYSYGSFKRSGCINFRTAKKKHLNKALQICVALAGCKDLAPAVVPYAQSIDVGLFASALGDNAINPDGTDV